MAIQRFADTVTEPINADFATISAITETVLIPTALTPINPFDLRGGKVFELRVWGTATTGLAGTLIITPRFGTTIGGTSLGPSPAQNYVPSITTAPFTFVAWLWARSQGLPGANTTIECAGEWHSGGAVATAGSATDVYFSSTATSSIDASLASALWIGVTFSVAPSVIPRGHIWRTLN